MKDRREITQKLIEFLESDTEFHFDTFTENLSLREGLGLDSVDLVGIIMRIEGHYRIRLTHAELDRINTVGTLLDLIQAKLEHQAANPVLAPDSKAA
jgi:acyl carrier protein